MVGMQAMAIHYNIIMKLLTFSGVRIRPENMGFTIFNYSFTPNKYTHLPTNFIIGYKAGRTPMFQES